MSKILNQKWLLVTLATLYILAIAAAMIWQLTHPVLMTETELDVIRSITENISEYQEEIASWGYQIPILPQDADEIGYREYSSLHFYFDDDDTVLILTDADGGMYCFYYGFDRYIKKSERPQTVKEEYGDGMIEAVRKVEMSVSKSEQRRPAYRENTEKAGTRGYYDAMAHVYVDVYSADDGKWLSWPSDSYYTYYCSNNFEECQWFGHSLHHSNEWINERGDSGVKKEYSAEELLAFYRQGVELQENLVTLYYENE